ncbi:hypothetical protein GCM10023258_02950 [Terrabacter aeriphilus]|uniref:Secreted protein n=1 Tax=Terrabacter aeriphilus TaxID=515662 RepID=A0ABP9J0X5_9MICO
MSTHGGESGQGRRYRHVAGVIVPALLVVLALWVWGRTPSSASLAADGPRSATPVAERSVAPFPTVPPVGAAPTTPPSTQATTPSSTPAGTPAGTPAAPPTATPSITTSEPGGTAGTAGTGLDAGRSEPGIRLDAATGTDGSVAVTERVRLVSAVDVLRLAVPDLTAGGPAFATARPGVRDLRVTVGGSDVPLAARGADGLQLVALPGSTTAYELHYVLTGATVRSMPSRPGRALTGLAPLSRPEAGTSVVVATIGSSVLNLTCPLLADAGDVTCSDGIRGRMTVRAPLPDSAALVVLQVELAGSG